MSPMENKLVKIILLEPLQDLIFIHLNNVPRLIDCLKNLILNELQTDQFQVDYRS